MKRAYFIADNLDEIERVELELEQIGIAETQMKVLSEDEMAVQAHRLHSVPSFFQKDIVHQGTRGAMVGLLLSTGILLVASQTGITGVTGTSPFIMLSAFVFGFSTWIGGFIGIQQTNYKFRDLVKVVARGRHVFFVDFSESQEKIIKNLTARHPRLSPAGFGSTSINPFIDEEAHAVR